LKAFTAQSGSPREDIDWNNSTLRQRGRMLYMASPVATSAIKTSRTSVIGIGLQFRSRIHREILGLSPEAAKEWQRKAEAEFALWANHKQNCDAIGVNNFYSMQQLALQSWLMSGDVFPLIKRYKAKNNAPYTLRVHLVEADRIATPNEGASVLSFGITDGKTEEGNRIYDGVEVNDEGMIVAYHIRNTYPYQLTSDKTKWIRVPAYGELTGLPNILHIMDSERPDQYRGVSYLAPVIEELLQLRRYTESELMAALVQSFFTAWIKTDTDPTEIPMNETGGGSIVGLDGEESDNFSVNPNEYEMGPATVLHLEDDEDVVFGNPNIPTSGFKDFVETICELVGAALEIPKDILLKNFNSSYSASRGAMLHAWEAFKMRRQWFVNDFCQPVYEIWLSEAVAMGRIKAPGFFNDPLIRAAWCGSRWIGPAQGQLDPTKEAKAAIMNVDRGFKTHEQITVEMDGGDWEENVEQLARENELLKNAGGGNYMTSLAENDREGGTETDE
nr:phage portal protein [Sphaerochaetaceae bacterium]